MENDYIPANIWWCHDLVRMEANPSTPIDEPDDLYAMPVAELRWSIDNREEI